MVRHKIIKVYSSCCRRQKGKPASCAGCELCGREPALPAFSTGAHPLKRACAVPCFLAKFRFNTAENEDLRVNRIDVRVVRVNFTGSTRN